MIRHPSLLAAFLLSFGGPPPWISTKTIDVPVVHRDLDESADLLRRFTSERGSIVVNEHRKMLRIADLPWEVDRLAQLLRDLDEPEAPAQKIWLVPVRCMIARDFAAIVNAILDPRARAHVGKIVPENRAGQLIIVADRAGYGRIRQIRVIHCPDLLHDDTGLPRRDAANPSPAYVPAKAAESGLPSP